MLLKQLTESISLAKNGALQTGYGLVFIHGGDRVKSYDLDNMEVFLDVVKFYNHVGTIFEEFTENGGGELLAQMHGDPKVQAELQNKVDRINKKKHPKPAREATSLEDLHNRPGWDEFLDAVFILDKF
jgi:hypothetical protein